MTIKEAGEKLDKGEELLEMIRSALGDLEGAGAEEEMAVYRAYLHGQIYGLSTALRILYPGPGNLGERAALAVRPVVTEHNCQCPEDREL